MLRGATRGLRRKPCEPHTLLRDSRACRRLLSHGRTLHEQQSRTAESNENVAPPLSEKPDPFAKLIANVRHDPNAPERRKRNTKPKQLTSMPLTGRLAWMSSTGADQQEDVLRNRAVTKNEKPFLRRRPFSPLSNLTNVLERNELLESSLKAMASAKSTRIADIVMQKLTRERPDLFPQLESMIVGKEQWGRALHEAQGKGYTPEELDRFVYIIAGDTDDARCERFLEDESFKPTVFLKYLLRPISTFTSIDLLSRFLEYCSKWFDQREWETLEGAPLPKDSSRYLLLLQHYKPREINDIASRLAELCLLIDPRLLVKLAGVMARYIESMATYRAHPRQIYNRQCSVFNTSLKLFRPLRDGAPAKWLFPNEYLWEAQQTLLNMSSGFEKPLMIDRSGFQVIREVLASQPKSRTEMHSSSRQAATWPPFLQLGDGLDEDSMPEDNWSRAVRAGMMMQEAGFPKTHNDEALDILQGMAPDRTPTIQQRTMWNKKRPTSVWESSIRATRNAQEAWQRFLNPPEVGLKPDSFHYAAMFEKLHLPDVDLTAQTLPGDKAVNFPIYTEHNLVEIEQAQLRPPSISQLYERMLVSGMRPKGTCLRILVANAENLMFADKYLRDSDSPEVVEWLKAENLSLAQIQRIPLGIVTAYISVLSRGEGGLAGPQMRQAIQLANAYQPTASLQLVPFLWGPILQNLSQHHLGLGLSVSEQLDLVLQVFERIDKGHGVNLPSFMLLAKCARKAARRELPQLLSDLSSVDLAKTNSLRRLYDGSLRREQHDLSSRPSSGVEVQRTTQDALTLFNDIANRIKDTCNTLVLREQKVKDVLLVHGLSALDQMAARTDPVRAEHAFTYTLTMAMLGEYEEMGRMLQWLIQEWGSPEIVEAIEELDEPPAYADFSDTLCAFRMLAEPMLDASRADSLREAIAAAGLPWTWPDDDALKIFADSMEDHWHTLTAVQKWIRFLEEKESLDAL